MTAFRNKLDEGSKTEWISPPEIVRALEPPRFDLDPCSPRCPPHQLARHTFNVADDGLSREWFGRVWLNPPYDKHLYEWLGRLHRHGNGVALIFARTDTRYFKDFVWTASGVLFLSRRVTFLHVDGSVSHSNSGAPSVLVAYGKQNVMALRVFEQGVTTRGGLLTGKLIELSGGAAARSMAQRSSLPFEG